MNPATTLAGICLTTISLSTALSAQAISSKSYFMPSVEMANGGTCYSTSYTSNVALGSGIVLPAMFSASYRMTGGYAATLDVAPGTDPWITHVSPAQLFTNGKAKMTIHGINLNTGTNPAIDVGGKAATLVSRTSETIVATQPVLTAPGYPTVSVSNSLAASSVTKSVGVLPILECEPAPAPNIPFDVVFRGTKGDMVIWAVAANSSAPIPIAGLFHGLQVNPLLMVILPGVTITAADGVFRFSSPPVAYPQPLYLHAAFISTNPGYAPGSFCNLVTL